jgi:hypothetical protein
VVGHVLLDTACEIERLLAAGIEQKKLRPTCFVTITEKLKLYHGADSTELLSSCVDLKGLFWLPVMGFVLPSDF